MQQSERTSILVHGASQSQAQSSSSRPPSSSSSSAAAHSSMPSRSTHYHTGASFNEVDHEHTGNQFDTDDTVGSYSWWRKARASSCSSTQACWSATAVAALLLLLFIILSLSSSSSSSSSSPSSRQTLMELVSGSVGAEKVSANLNDKEVVPPSPVTFASKAGSQLQSVLPIPSAPEGFCLGGCTSPSLPGRDIELELYFDLLCPYSAEAWPTIKRVIQHYDTKNKDNNDALIPRLHVQLHLFPLPYHMFAFIVNQATFAVQQNQLAKSKNEEEGTAQEKARDAVIQWMELIFKNQNRFQEHVLSKRVSEILDTVNEMGRSSSLLPSSLTNSSAGLASDLDTNMALRTSFKIACQRGVTGTPQFFINGVMLFADSGWKMAAWTSLIDSLLTPGRA